MGLVRTQVDHPAAGGFSCDRKPRYWSEDVCFRLRVGVEPFWREKARHLRMVAGCGRHAEV